MTQTLAQSGPSTHFPSVGRWLVTAMPSGWIYVADFGIRQMSVYPKAITANIGLGQENVADDFVLAEYIEKQKKMIGSYLAEAVFAGPQSIPFADSDEAQLLFVRHRLQNQLIMLHAQTYVRSAQWLGIITMTVLEAQLQSVRPDYDAFVKGLRIAQLAQERRA